MGDQVKFVLDETQIPKSWYNLTADLPKPLPPVLHPGTKQPVEPQKCALSEELKVLKLMARWKLAEPVPRASAVRLEQLLAEARLLAERWGT